MNVDKILKMTIKHDDYMAQYLQDRENQRIWLETNLEEFAKDGNIDAFIHSIECVVKARGRGAITALAHNLKMDRSNLSEILNHKTTPHLATIFKLLQGLGYTCHIALKSA